MGQPRILIHLFEIRVTFPGLTGNEYNKKENTDQINYLYIGRNLL